MSGKPASCKMLPAEGPLRRPGKAEVRGMDHTQSPPGWKEELDPAGGGYRPGRRVVRARGLSLMHPFLRLCPDCGVPLSISRNHSWKEDGRILSPDSAQRLVIMERRVVEGILRRAAEMFGEEASRILTRCKAMDAFLYVRSIMTGWKRMAAKAPFGGRHFYDLLCDQARILGMADARVISYRKRRELLVGCTQCYSEAFFAGDVLGAVQAGEGREAEVTFWEEKGEKRFGVTIGGREVPTPVLPTFEEDPLPGNIVYRRCGRCRAPFPVSFFAWDTARGLVLDTHNGETVAMLDTAGMNAAYLEIKRTRLPELDELLAREIKEMVDRVLPRLEWKRRGPEERVRDLFFLAYRGMGNPIFTRGSGKFLEARVENPFNHPIVAGITASFLSRGEPVSWEWERKERAALEVRVSFL